MQEKYMAIYQRVSEFLASEIPEDDSALSPRAKYELTLANQHVIKVLDHLSNINVILDDPDIEDKDLL